MKELDKLEQHWNQTLQIVPQEGFYNYHPVVARHKFERHLEAQGEIFRFKLAENQNVTTSLRERDHTETSRLKFIIQEGKLRAEFEDEPHEETIIRGRDYRKTHGSKELAREESEVTGFQTLQEVLTSKDTPVGTRFIMISGPGLIRDTMYAKNFVDFWELREDEFKKKYVEYTRFSSSVDYRRYQEIVKALVPNYFDGLKGPIDAWLLGHPIPVLYDAPAEEIFDLYFERDPKAMKEEIFLERLRIYQPYIQNYLNELTEPEFNPVKIAKSYNSIQLSTDHRMMQTTDARKIIQNVNDFGWMEPTRIKAGCGWSGGFKVSSQNMPFENSVGQFGQKMTAEDAKKDPNLCKCGNEEAHFHCDGKTPDGKDCKQEIIVGKGITQCPKCGEGKKC